MTSYLVITGYYAYVSVHMGAYIIHHVTAKHCVVLIAVKEGLACKGQSCIRSQCTIVTDQYCFDFVSVDHQGDSTYSYNGTTRSRELKLCLLGKGTFMLRTTAKQTRNAVQQ